MRVGNLAGRAVLVRPDGAIDIAAASRDRFGPGLPQIFDRWAEFQAWAAAAPLPAAQPFEQDRLGPVSPMPRQIFAVGLNYVDHTKEAGFTQPETPMIFTKFASSIAAPFGALQLSSEHVDWEIEMVAVIGTTASGVSPDDAWAHIAGLTIGQDYSDRALQMRDTPPQFSLGKSYAGYAPVGPYLTTLDELGDPANLDLECTIDDAVVQQGNTADMVFSVPALIAHLSSVCTLYPGDLVFTGTPPGVGMGRTPVRYLKGGETVVSRIAGLGEIRQTCVESKRSVLSS